MRTVLLCLLLAGCALGRVDAGGELVGLAVGHARLEVCHRGYEDEELQQSVAAGEQCSRIEGGAISTGFADFLATAATAVGAWFGLGL